MIHITHSIMIGMSSNAWVNCQQMFWNQYCTIWAGNSKLLIVSICTQVITGVMKICEILRMMSRSVLGVSSLWKQPITSCLKYRRPRSFGPPPPVTMGNSPRPLWSATFLHLQLSTYHDYTYYLTFYNFYCFSCTLNDFVYLKLVILVLIYRHFASIFN